MWRDAGARAMRFAAVEEFAVDRVAFRWRARFPVAGPVAIRVVDEYAAGRGRLEARIFGVPVMRQAGRATVVGEALRYLAELPWVPHAMAHNPALEWHELGDHSVEVACRAGVARPAVTIEFDAAGDIVRAGCAARPRLVGKSAVPTPWGGDYGDYRVLGGMRMPARAEVYWELAGGRFVYWRGSLTAADAAP